MRRSGSDRFASWPENGQADAARGAGHGPRGRSKGQIRVNCGRFADGSRQDGRLGPFWLSSGSASVGWETTKIFTLYTFQTYVPQCAGRVAHTS